MGGALMFFAIAVSTVTYGWTPDGASGVQYIIQIPPEKLDQVARSGEISSQIPEEIRGHVSQVIVRVGNERLPRVTPKSVSRDVARREAARRASPLVDQVARCDEGSGMGSAMSIQDQMPMPIPSMTPSQLITPINGLPTPSSPTAMMKPSPQGGGMNLPGGYTAPNTAPTANQATSNAGGLDQAISGAGQAIQDRLRNGIDNVRDSVNQAMNRNNAMGANPVNRGSGTIDVDDPRYRLANPNGDAAAASAQSQAGAAAASGPRTRLQIPSTEPAEAARTNGFAYQPTRDNTVPSTSAREDDWFDLKDRNRRRPSTDPYEQAQQESANDLRGNGNFARFPDALRNDSGNSQNNFATAANSTRQTTGGLDDRANDPSVGDYHPRLTAAQARQLPENGYDYDDQGYAIDREGYRLNRFGQRIASEPSSNTALGTMANQQFANARSQSPQQSYGQQTYSQGNASMQNGQQPDMRSSMPQGTNHATVPNSAIMGYQNSNGYSAQSGYQNQTPYASTNGYGAPGYAQQNGGVVPNGYQVPATYASNPGANQPGTLPAMPPMNPNYVPQIASAAQPTTMPNAQPPFAPSQQPSAQPPVSQPNASTVGGTTPTATDSRRDEGRYSAAPSDRYDSQDDVAAQPIFNGLLLLSFVANVYLLFWLKNLRLQFRDMVASKRSNSANAALA